MYTISNFKYLADLQEELDSLEQALEEKLETTVRPAMKKAICDLYDMLKVFLEKGDLDVVEGEGSFNAAYKKMSIGVLIVAEGFALKLSINSEEVDIIKVITRPTKYSSPRKTVKNDLLSKKIEELQNDTDEIKGTLSSYDNLQVVYTNDNNQRFNAPEKVIEAYFK
ncbi:hypothetical protein [Sporosarcina sp. P7]|uniref:hypothetical protein n=1 Tax=Sporosarcina sp. P7 TaxID=2048244 RepID=UPI000C16C985|nr:hypothetical protein [Sporosarcina sp. P7]PID24928.1 hypothetical protein CSV60_06615 [Sporosarcina sp. P7]